MKTSFSVDTPQPILDAGFPSFEKFCANPERYLGKDDDKLAEVDKGGKGINAPTKKHIYEIEGFKCKSLEEVERVAKDFGIPVKDLDYKPEVIPRAGHKCDLYIKFVPKSVREKRADW